MRQKPTAKIAEERGEVMLEASFLLVSVMVLLLALLSVSFLFYQQSMMNSAANEIAADIAKNFKFTDLDVGSESLTLDDVNSAKMFRMSFSLNSLENAHENRAEDYANWRVPFTSLGLNPQSIQVDCEITRSGIGRAYVKATVSQKTDFFLSGILDMAGVADENTLFSATAYAECVDLMGYTSMVNFAQYASGELSAFNSIGGFYNSVKNLIQKLLG